MTEFVSASVWHSRTGFQSFLPARRLRADEAIRSMHAAWEGTRAGNLPQGTFVAGMAGTGKSTFLAKFVERAPRPKPLWVSGEQLALTDVDIMNGGVLLGTAAQDARSGDCVVIDALDQASWPARGSDGELDVDTMINVIKALETSARKNKYWLIASVRSEFLLRYQKLKNWLEEPQENRIYLTMGRWTLEDALQLVGAESVEAGKRRFLEKIWEPGRSGPARVEWYERPLFLGLIERLPASRLANFAETLSKAGTEAVYQIYKLVLDSEPKWAQEAIDEELRQRPELKPNIPLTLPVPPAVDLGQSSILRRVVNRLEFIHRTFAEFVTAQDIARRYARGDHGTFADYFFHWDTRLFLIHAMNEHAMNEKDDAQAYKPALRTAIGLQAQEPEEIELAFETYSRMIMEPYTLTERGKDDLCALAENIQRGSRERLNQRFLAYVLYDLRIFLGVRTLEISSYVEQPLTQLVAWLDQLLGWQDDQDPKLAEQRKHARKALQTA
jgi:hypothetical protein